MIQAFIKLRLIQILRAIKGLGPVRIVCLIGLAGFCAIGLFIQTAVSPKSLYATGIYLFVIALIQLNRPDKRFLKTHFSNFKLVFFIEYLLIMIPLLTCLIYHLQWISLISSIAFTGLIANLDIKIKQKSLNTFIQKLIPSDCFEWKGGGNSTTKF